MLKFLFALYMMPWSICSYTVSSWRQTTLPFVLMSKLPLTTSIDSHELHPKIQISTLFREYTDCSGWEKN